MKIGAFRGVRFSVMKRAAVNFNCRFVPRAWPAEAGSSTISRAPRRFSRGDVITSFLI
jgi:hypothetical protein